MPNERTDRDDEGPGLPSLETGAWFRRHCCVGRNSDTTPDPREPGHVYEPNEMADFGPHKSPISNLVAVRTAVRQPNATVPLRASWKSVRALRYEHGLRGRVRSVLGFIESHTDDGLKRIGLPRLEAFETSPGTSQTQSFTPSARHPMFAGLLSNFMKIVRPSVTFWLEPSDATGADTIHRAVPIIVENPLAEAHP